MSKKSLMVRSFGVIAIILSMLGLSWWNNQSVSMQVTEESIVTTISGATFKVQKNWFVSKHDDYIVLESPDKELSYTLIEINEPEADKAVELAWKKVDQNFNCVPQKVVVHGQKDQWEDRVAYEYNSQDLENDQVVRASAKLFSRCWYVSITHSSKVALKKYYAGLELVSSSFKVFGFKEESFQGKIAHELDKDRLEQFINFVEKNRILSEIPGVAIGIVQNGKVVFEKGFGVANLETQQPITPKTLFMIGSNTKSLTTCMMAKLIDEGFFNWDTPVTKLLPSFAVGDENLTKILTMKDMVNNANGMPQKSIENIFNYDFVTPESRIIAMKDEKPTTKLGQTFQYSNGMVAAGGYIAAHVVYPDMTFDQAYKKVMQEYLFNILDMESSTFNFEKANNSQHADPYNRDLNYKLTCITEDPLEYAPKLPSGGAWSNIKDINKYLLCELNNGFSSDNKVIITQENLLERRKPQIKISDTKSYGLGLVIADNCGIEFISHGGSVNGFGSQMIFLPEHNVGCVILTNLPTHFSGAFLEAVPRKLLEILFDGKDEAQNLFDVRLKQQKTQDLKSIESVDFNPPISWYSQFIGTYQNPKRGTVIIREVENGLELDARLWKARLAVEKKSDNEMYFVLVDGSFPGVSFLPQNHEGQIELIVDEGQQKQIFKKQV